MRRGRNSIAAESHSHRTQLYNFPREGKPRPFFNAMSSFRNPLKVDIRNPGAHRYYLVPRLCLGTHFLKALAQ